jgi:hypothetical protein
MYFFVALQFKLDLGRPVFEISRPHTIMHTDTQTRSMTSRNEWSARGRGRHLHNKHNRRTSVPSAGFVFMIPAIVQPQTYGSDRMATGIGILKDKSTGPRLGVDWQGYEGQENFKSRNERKTQ